MQPLLSPQDYILDPAISFPEPRGPGVPGRKPAGRRYSIQLLLAAFQTLLYSRITSHVRSVTSL